LIKSTAVFSISCTNTIFKSTARGKVPVSNTDGQKETQATHESRWTLKLFR